MADALLHLPAENTTLLTDQELSQITGANTRLLQVQWLRDNGWKFTTTRHGEPRVGRLYANLKLGGLELSSVLKNEEEEWQPNMAAINA